MKRHLITKLALLCITFFVQIIPYRLKLENKTLPTDDISLEALFLSWQISYLTHPHFIN